MGPILIISKSTVLLQHKPGAGESVRRMAVRFLAVSVVESLRRLVAIAGEALVALALAAGYFLYRRGRARAAPLPIVCAVLAGKARSAVDDSTFHAVIAQLLALLCAAVCWLLFLVTFARLA